MLVHWEISLHSQKQQKQNKNKTNALKTVTEGTVQKTKLFG